ncbi:MAG TPA: helix-turn-helix domain-containing protein [Anaeromyxobacteraceae bacterium]|nr:helix-turn-helix domain-containing protein [Anaeromyxobacteraceae bacterium]
MLKTPPPRAKPARARPRELPEDTRTRILDAAERLFAEQGVDAVSVRAVLREAGVNGALANYHFGSREGLIAELLRSRVAPLAEAQLRAIEEVDSRGDATLEDVLRAYMAPAARALGAEPHLGRLLGQLGLSASPAVRELGRDVLRASIRRLSEALVKRLAGPLDPARLLVRLYMVIGIPSFFASSWEVVAQSARKHLPGTALDATVMAEEFVAFTAAGLRAAPSAAQEE